MSKVIKFNLIVDGKSIRTLTDLRDNFNVDDVYELYRNGVLKKWLDVRGYAEEAAAVELLSEIKDESAFDVIPKLVKVFIEIDENNLNKYAQSSYATVLKLFNENRLKEAQENGFQKNSMIQKYHTSYQNIKKGLKANSKNFNYVKSYLQEIEKEYLGLFKLDYRHFYEEYRNEELLVVLLALANPSLREVLLEDPDIREGLDMFYYSEEEVLQKIGSHLQTYSGSTDGLWKYLGEKEKKFMVIHLDEGPCNVGEERAKNTDYSAEEVNGKFSIFNGLLFKSNYPYYGVAYMEV